MVKSYMVKVYAFMIKAGMRNVEELPENYREPVAIYMAEQEE